ncbi:hypothetical protein DYU11_22555 [Fibrisoma montanum]|uniref:Uncharacterized protein n=1 Tax=Fibrisoma montanum TaxID=2305895 RepID=A0A418M1T8_9BACT|nr:hypothetical protein DYU11_22555 [Fibrisoma montanum]
MKLPVKWIQHTALFVVSLLLISSGLSVAYCQDSICYSARENDALLRGLIELKELRKLDSAQAVSIRLYQASQQRIRSKLREYQRRGCFLFGYRRRIRELEAELLPDL